MRSAVIGTAHVLLRDRVVGELGFRSGGCHFVYTDNLLDPEHAVLGQVFEDAPRKTFSEQTGLPAWFANLLPERGSGLRRFYAARFGEREIDDARLLLSLGADLPGAAVVVPIDVPAEGVLVDRAAVRIDGVGLHLAALAGAQPKLSVTRDGHRFTLPADGAAGDWIAKLPDTAVPGLIENEFMMMRWAADAGLNVPRVDLVPARRIPPVFDVRVANGGHAYVVERFDRGEDGSRIHMEDLAQVTGRFPAARDDPAVTYDGIGRLVLEIAGEADFVEYTRRLVAMVLMGNCDAHLKNWTLWYPDGRAARLAPAYDLVCTTYYPAVRRQLTFTLAGMTRSESVGRDAFRSLAETAGYGADLLMAVDETANALRASWREIRKDAPLPAIVDHIDRRLSRHPLLT